MAWGKKSGRVDPLPDKWPAIRMNKLRSDKFKCQHIREDTGKICGARATDVDHIGDRNNHRFDNLQSLCSYHHDIKTAGQGGRAAAAKRAKPQRHAGVEWLD